MNTIASKFPVIDELGPYPAKPIIRQFDAVFRAVMRGPAVTAVRDFFRYVTNEPHPFGNFAILSDSDRRDHAEAAVEPLLNLNAPTAIIFLGTVSDDVGAYVQEHGYVLAEAMPAMGVNIDSLARTSLPAGYTFTQVTSLEHDAAWCEAFAAGYGIPRRVADDFGPRTAADLLRSNSVQYFGIMHGSTMVSTSMLYLDGSLAGVYCVSTLPEHRGKGLAAFATAQPLRQVRSLGYRTGILQSSAMGESVYRRLGFQQFGVMPLYVRMPAGMSAAH